MHRFARAIVAVLTAVTLDLGVSLTAEAQGSAKVHRIGVLATAESGKFRESLRELGYIEGRNAVLRRASPWEEPIGSMTLPATWRV